MKDPCTDTNLLARAPPLFTLYGSHVDRRIIAISYAVAPVVLSPVVLGWRKRRLLVGWGLGRVV